MKIVTKKFLYLLLKEKKIVKKNFKNWLKKCLKNWLKNKKK